MVKNELSIGAQRSYDVALKIAEHKIRGIKEGTGASISHYKAKVSFKTEKQEKILFETRKRHLIENLDALYSTNQYDAKVTLLKNNTLMHRLNWSFVKVDRSNPNKELIKKQIALNRHATVIYDMNYERAVFDAKWFNIEKDKEIKLKLETDRLTQELYKDNVKREKISYNDFYQNTLTSHKQLVAECKETISKFYPVIEEVIDYSYIQSTALEVRKQILETVKTIVDLYKKLEEIDIALVNKDVDLQILEIQIKEKLDVFDERKELLEEIGSLKTQKESLTIEIQNVSAVLEQLLNERVVKKLSNFELNVSVEDEKQMAVLNDIKESFKQPSNEVFGTIYRIVKDYILSICPFFYDYLQQQEELYEKENENYRKEMVASLSDDLAKAYLSSNKEYLSLISTQNDEENTLETLKAKYQEQLEEIDNLYSKEMYELKLAKENRIEEYKQQKASAKINLKNADGAKASEIKEIVRLYKKEIRTGELKRKFKVLKQKFLRKKEARANYKLAVIQATNPAPIAYEHSYKKVVAADKKVKHIELKALNRSTNKDYNSSKYRKNLNNTKRENGLGYLFLSVWAIGFIVFALIPMAYTVLMFFSKVTYDNQGYSTLIDFSFTSGLTFPNWVGFDNFETLILQDIDFAFTMIPRFFRSLLFYVPIVVFISFVLAMLLNSKIKGRTFFRVIYFLPVVIVSGPVLEMLNKQNSSGQSSIRLSLDGSSIAKILVAISPKALEYANEIFQNFIIILWMTGVPIVLFISALQKINRQLYEAAEIDGANKWQMLWTITYPLIKSVLLIVCLFTIMQVTTINVDFVNPINTWIDAKLGQTNFNIGLVSVGCWIQTLVVLLFVLVSFLLFREKEFVSKDKNYEEIEEAKRKKNQKKAKLVSMFKINEIKHFFSNLFAPLSRAVATAKAKSKEKGD